MTVKTFVAECVDGPKAGKLYRGFVGGSDHLIIPCASGGAYLYDLTKTADGRQVWKLTSSPRSPDEGRKAD